MEGPFSPRQVTEGQDKWAQYLGVPVETSIDLGEGVAMKFTFIPPRNFVMGGTKEEQVEYVKTLQVGEKVPEWFDWELPPT